MIKKTSVGEGWAVPLVARVCSFQDEKISVSCAKRKHRYLFSSHGGVTFYFGGCDFRGANGRKRERMNVG